MTKQINIQALLAGFFEKNSLLAGKKQDEFLLWANKIKHFLKLKNVRKRGQRHNTNEIVKIIRKTYYMNSTPSSRRLSLDEYLKAIIPCLEDGSLQFY